VAWINDIDGNLVNLAHVHVLFITDLTEDGISRWQITASTPEGEIVLREMKSQELAKAALDDIHDAYGLG
jgi:hypothetical protein